MPVSKSKMPSAREKYRELFGHVESMDKNTPWTIGVANLWESFAWNPGQVLGVSKSELTKRIVTWCISREHGTKTSDQIEKEVSELIKQGQLHPTEAARKGRFHSERYLNIEFDICWSLASNRFLDEFYRAADFEFPSEGGWCSLGGGEYLGHSLSTLDQPDNLTYKRGDPGFLIGNELKLDGKKNRDQALKYARLFSKLRLGFVSPQTTLGLLFIGADGLNLQEALELEISDPKNDKLRSQEILKTAREIQIRSISWADVIAFNMKYLKTLREDSDQVEYKLISGFNESLCARRDRMIPSKLIS